jgi:hypothetical protein
LAASLPPVPAAQATGERRGRPVLDGRAWEREEGAEELVVPDTLYADDTGEFFRLRAHAVQDVPRLVKFLARFGLFVHVELPG